MNSILPHELHITTWTPYHHMNSILPHELHITTWTPHYHMNSTLPHELHITKEKTPKVNTEDVLSFAGTYFRGQLSSNQFAGIKALKFFGFYNYNIALLYTAYLTWHQLAHFEKSINDVTCNWCIKDQRLLLHISTSFIVQILNQ